MTNLIAQPTLDLPDWLDTNQRYEIWWNPVSEAWEVVPF